MREPASVLVIILYQDEIRETLIELEAPLFPLLQ